MPKKDENKTTNASDGVVVAEAAASEQPPADPAPAPEVQPDPAPVAPAPEVQPPPQPEPQEQKATGAKRGVVNKSCAGLTIYGVTGVPMVFDENGEAEVSEEEFAHLMNVPGYEAKQ